MAETSELNEWTLMFYFAGDNALSPVIVSQLKAIKDAGFQENTDVVVHFDPNEKGAPTRIYDVNRERKRNPRLPNTMIGDGSDPFVRNMEEDDIKFDSIDANAGDASKAMIQALQDPDAINAKDALINFLGFCRENHRAKRYMLFLVGHGMIVGNDAFLPDDNPVAAITLKELREILRPFSLDVNNDGGAFEMLALHSCSMSAIEVAYQLKDTAKFMIASEGTSFVNSWPYRQLLKKTFKHLEDAKDNARMRAKEKDEDQEAAAKNPDVDVETLLEKLYYLAFFNATDFMLSGYSLDLCLCSLEGEKFRVITEQLQELVKQLKAALGSERGKELILLAHWESQSYWGESYTDLFDFCRCLSEKCDKNNELQELSKACHNVMEALKPIESKEVSERFKALVVRSHNFGSEYQYSHGLSVYFPWSRPIENVGNGVAGAKKGVLERYREYAFTDELKDHSWLSFLDSYFIETQRVKTRSEEDGIDESRSDKFIVARMSFDPVGALSGGLPFSLTLDPKDPPKPSPRSGLACTCPSIKNHPTEERKVKGKTKRNVKAFSISDELLDAFK